MSSFELGFRTLHVLEYTIRTLSGEDRSNTIHHDQAPQGRGHDDLNDRTRRTTTRRKSTLN
jgi:hypothetical protein